ATPAVTPASLSSMTRTRAGSAPCKDCGKIFVDNPQRRHYSDELKKIAIRLYTDGVEIAVIARSLEVPYETVRSWLRAAGEKAIKKNRIEEEKVSGQNI
ncbi:MAG: transposase, partial [Brevundimonas sp.]